MIMKGAKWILRKRLPDDLEGYQAGLLPAGFSAEHLGPNNFYYWDDFWGVAGLKAAVSLMKSFGDEKNARYYWQKVKEFHYAIEESLKHSLKVRQFPGIPASPYRRMDAGAIGSVVASYPLRLYKPDDQRVLNTVEYLLENCFVKGAFFQEMIHSGINAYLTLHIAQVLLRAGDERFFQLVKTIADLASPTGQWPEAIHPITRGGCMGDGQHVWAAAEWIIMVRNLFIREEGNTLLLATGIIKEWLDQEKELYLGPTLTSFGKITLHLKPSKKEITLFWEASWHDAPPKIEVRLPGFTPLVIDDPGQTEVSILRD